MEGKKVDRRILRTKMAIHEAFISLMNEKGFDATMVSDIAERANINRGTFYVHYQDKFDLLEKTQSGIAENIQKIFLQENNLNISDIYMVDKPLPIIVSFFEFLKENKNLMLAMFNLKGGMPFQTRIRQLIQENLKIEFVAGFNKNNFLVPSDYLISYAISAHFGVVQDWLKRGCIETPEEMAIIFAKITCLGVLQCTGLTE